jgi:hypothetical protein
MGTASLRKSRRPSSKVMARVRAGSGNPAAQADLSVEIVTGR